MKTIDELVDELAVRLNSGQTVKQKKVAKPVSAPKPEAVKASLITLGVRTLPPNAVEAL